MLDGLRTPGPAAPEGARAVAVQPDQRTRAARAGRHGPVGLDHVRRCRTRGHETGGPAGRLAARRRRGRPSSGGLPVAATGSTAASPRRPGPRPPARRRAPRPAAARPGRDLDGGGLGRQLARRTPRAGRRLLAAAARSSTARSAAGLASGVGVRRRRRSARRRPRRRGPHRTGRGRGVPGCGGRRRPPSVGSPSPARPSAAGGLGSARSSAGGSSFATASRRCRGDRRSGRGGCCRRRCRRRRCPRRLPPPLPPLRRFSSTGSV